MPSRESELYKDKVEVSLDGRQIFYLFFGGAVIVGIVFVLGVLVGRRVEARGHVDRARTTAAADPLAALDRLEASDGMAFRGALTGKDTVAPVEKKIDQIAAEKKKPEKKDEAKTEAKAEAKAEAKPEAKVEVKPEAKVEKKEEKKEEKVAEKPTEKPIEKPSDQKPEPKAEPKEDKTRYTLQLSSFQDKAEAEAYLAKMKEQGYQAQITQADVEGKGTFYRVRMGSYRSLDAATTAKSDFEKTSSKTASIMKL